MPDNLKIAWVTPRDDIEMFSLTLESAWPENDWERIRASELAFPTSRSDKRPRHTIHLGLFSLKDMRMLRDILDRFLQEE